MKFLERDEKEEILLEVDHEDHQTHDSSFTFVLIMDTKIVVVNISDKV